MTKKQFDLSETLEQELKELKRNSILTYCKSFETALNDPSNNSLSLNKKAINQLIDQLSERDSSCSYELGVQHEIIVCAQNGYFNYNLSDPDDALATAIKEKQKDPSISLLRLLTNYWIGSEDDQTSIILSNCTLSELNYYYEMNPTTFTKDLPRM